MLIREEREVPTVCHLCYLNLINSALIVHVPFSCGIKGRVKTPNHLFPHESLLPLQLLCQQIHINQSYCCVLHKANINKL